MLFNKNMVWLAKSDKKFEDNLLVAEESQITKAGQ